MKRVIAFALVLAVMSVSTLTYARASDQLSSYSLAIITLGNGEIRVTASVNGTHPKMIEIGFPTISLRESSDGGATYTICAIKGPEYTSNQGSYVYSFVYKGTKGYKYYASASFYAEDAYGSDLRSGNSVVTTAT